MEQMSHEEQHRDYPEGTVVMAENGERLGTIRTVHPHYLLVRQEEDPEHDLDVPVHAIGSYDGEKLYLTVDRRALSVVDADVDAV